MSLDWEAAKEHLASAQHALGLVRGLSGVDWRFFERVVGDVQERYDRGERTEHLYREIMEISL